ncbi:MAG: minor capsid protein, partial [Clostridiales bacterium]|nr:minor capsid protein [Clostridiales bacterium]
NARRLVMTECSYVANQGHLMGYQAAGIEYYIYLATLDLRTSEVCRKLDGQRFPVAEATPGTNLPPMHPHCRSTTMCDMSRGQLNRVNRAARDPVTGKSVTIPGYMTYKEWYAKYVEGKNEVEKSGEDGILNGTDIRAIQDYMSSGVAYPLNDALRNGDTLTTTQAQLVRDLDTALTKLPDYEGTVYRSVSTSMIDDPAAFLAQHQENNVVKSPAYTSTGKTVYDPSMEIQYVITSKRGKDISSINVKEQEVLFKRNTKFIVERVDGKTLYMTEV